MNSTSTVATLPASDIERAKAFYQANGFVALRGESRRLCLPMDKLLQAAKR